MNLDILLLLYLINVVINRVYLDFVMNSKITKKFNLTRKFLNSLIIIVIPRTFKIIIIKILIFIIFRDYFQWIIIVSIQIRSNRFRLLLAIHKYFIDNY